MNTLVDVKQFAAASVGVSKEHVRTAKPLLGGENHRQFRVSFDNHADVVVRINNLATEADRSRALIEARFLQNTRDIGPRLFGFDDNKTWFDEPTLCLEYIEGDTRTYAHYSSEHAQALGELAATVHDAPTDSFANKYLTVGEYAEDMFDTDRFTYAHAIPHIAELIEHSGDELTTQVQKHSAPLFSPPYSEVPLRVIHGDPSPENVIWNGMSPRLIDWEYARLGDAAEEVAIMLIVDDELPSELHHAFFTGYAKVHEPDDAFLARVEMWKIYKLYASGLWWLDRWKSTENATLARKDSSGSTADACFQQASIRFARLKRLLSQGASAR